MRLCFAMVFRYPLYHIGVHNSLQVLEVIPTRVGYQSEVDHRFSSSNGWLNLILLISKEIGISIFHWWSFLTITATIHPYQWLLMKPCMVRVVGLLLGGLKFVSLHFSIPILYDFGEGSQHKKPIANRL